MYNIDIDIQPNVRNFTATNNIDLSDPAFVIKGYLVRGHGLVGVDIHLGQLPCLPGTLNAVTQLCQPVAALVAVVAEVVIPATMVAHHVLYTWHAKAASVCTEVSGSMNAIYSKHALKH